MIRWAKVAVVVERKDEGAFIANDAGFGEKRIWHCLNIIPEPFVLCENGTGVRIVFRS